MLRKIAIWVAVAVCVCTAGCTTKIRGEATAAGAGPATTSTAPAGPSASGSSSPSAEPSSDSGSGSDTGSGGSGGDSGSDLAKYRTTDVCSYLRTDAFKKIDANAKVQYTNGDYSSCYLSAQIKNKQKKTSSFFLSNQFVDGSDAQTIGSRFDLKPQRSSRSGLTVYSGTSQQSGCVRAIVLSDDLTLGLTAKNNAGALATGCPIADAMLDSALSIIADGSAGKLKVSANDLATQDLCSKLEPAATRYLGADPKTTQQLHGCVWSHGAQNSVSVTLRLDTWPPGFPSPNAKPETVAGHPASVSVTSSVRGTLSISEMRMSASPISPQQFDVISAIAASKDAPAAVHPRVTTFLAAVAGLQ